MFHDILLSNTAVWQTVLQGTTWNTAMSLGKTMAHR